MAAFSAAGNECLQCMPGISQHSATPALPHIVCGLPLCVTSKLLAAQRHAWVRDAVADWQYTEQPLHREDQRWRGDMLRSVAVLCNTAVAGNVVLYNAEP